MATDSSVSSTGHRRAARAFTWNCELNELTNPGDIRANSSELATRTAWAVAKRDEVSALSAGDAGKRRRQEMNAPIYAPSMKKDKVIRYEPHHYVQTERKKMKYYAAYKQQDR